MILTRDLLQRVEAFHLAISRDDFVTAEQERFAPGDAATMSNAMGTAIWSKGGNETAIRDVPSTDRGQDDDLDELLEWFRSRGQTSKVRVTLDPLAHQVHIDRFARYGARYESTTPVLLRPLDQHLPSESRDVELVDDAIRHEATLAIAGGFMGTRELRPERIRPAQVYMAISDVEHYVVRRGSEIAGGASLYVRDDFALLTGMSVLKEHRGQRIQHTLLLHRLHRARELGARVAVLTAAPCGTSQRNAERIGFRVHYARVNLQLPL